MPSLVVEDDVVILEKENEDTPAPSTTSHPSKTPFKSSSQEKQSRVTPDEGNSKASSKKRSSASSKKQSLPAATSADPSKKQPTIMSFFKAPSSSSGVKRSKVTSKSNDKPLRSSQPKPTLASTAPRLMKSTVEKPAPSNADKESLRDVVVGKVLSPLLEHPLPKVDLTKHQGSPLPRNLVIPGISATKTPRQRLLDLLEQQPTPHANLAKNQANTSVEEPTEEMNPCHEGSSSLSSQILELTQPSVEEAEENGQAVDQTTQNGEETQDDEVKTVCFSDDSHQLVEQDEQGLVLDEEMPDAQEVNSLDEHQNVMGVTQGAVDLTATQEMLQDGSDDVIDLEQPTQSDGAEGKDESMKDDLVDSNAEAPSVEKTPQASNRKATKPNDSTVKAVEVTTDPERLEQMAKNEALRSKTLKRYHDISERSLDEEDFKLPDPSTVDGGDSFDDDKAVTKLAMIVQGSDLPLADLSNKALALLKGDFKGLNFEAISEKIKTYFVRENYLTCSPSEMKTINIFEDAAKRHWRWEILTLDLLPVEVQDRVRMAQVARKKIRNDSKAIIGLLRALDDADKVLLNATSKQDQCDKLMAKVSTAEESVLKHERAAEKLRLAEEARRKKEQSKREKELEKQKAKDLKKEELANKKKEADKKKEEAAKKKEEEKQKKIQEQEEKKRKEEEKRMEEEKAKAEEAKKNFSYMMGFFKKPAVKSSSAKRASPVPQHVHKSSGEVAKFWGLIDSLDRQASPLFPHLSAKAKSSRKRRTKKVAVSVYVTVTSPDAFGEQQPYAEQQTLYFPNKYKFLSFFEDHRPAYHGTWCKKSKVVTGRTPFGQDKKQLNYDEDSEAEWEEGDDELGEDLNDEAADGEDEDMDPEEGDTRAYNYADGWMAEDDDVIYEDEEVDDETRILRKKLKSTTLQLSEELVASINGVPLLEVVKKNASFDVSRFVHVCAESISGLTSNPLELEVLASEAEILCTDDICLDAFPPTLVDENFVGDPSQIGASAPKTSSTSSNQEMSTEDLKLFAIFVHHSTFPSKDRLVEELRQAHPKVTSSRAQATRKLDVIATKVKNPVGSGVIWEIKREVLQELGLKKQLAMKLPEPEQKKNVVLKDETQKKPTVKSSDRKESAATPVAAKKVAKSSSVEKKSSSTGSNEKKRKPQVDPASAALLKNFVCVKKAKTD